MAWNQKLTGVLAGRKLTSVEGGGGELKIGFDDESTMTVRTAGPAGSSPQPGATVRAVRQQGTRLSLDFVEGGTLEIETAAPTSSVLVRDRNHQLEYAD